MKVWCVFDTDDCSYADLVYIASTEEKANQWVEKQDTRCWYNRLYVASEEVDSE